MSKSAVGFGAAFEEGKWFATTLEDAVRWGRLVPPVSRPRLFRIAFVRVPTVLLATFVFSARLDGIGPAYFVHRDQLSTLNATGTVRIDSMTFLRDPLHERTN